MASFLPVRPFGFPRTLRVFGGQTGYSQSLDCISASRAVHAIPTSRPQHRCRCVLSCVRFYPFTEAQWHLTQAFLPFSMSKRKGPFSPLNLLIQRLHSVALLWRSPTLRVWLPSQRLPLLFPPLHPSFRIQRSWASPCKAFLLLRDPKRCFHLPFRSCALRGTHI
jgi:hypothetical protein